MRFIKTNPSYSPEWVLIRNNTFKGYILNDGTDIYHEYMVDEEEDLRRFIGTEIMYCSICNTYSYTTHKTYQP